MDKHLARDDTGFFKNWYGQEQWYCLRFLHPAESRNSIVNLDGLRDVGPELPPAQQVAAAIWWNCVRQEPAPWMQDPLAQMWRLPPDMLEEVAELMSAMPARIRRLAAERHAERRNAGRADFT